MHSLRRALEDGHNIRAKDAMPDLTQCPSWRTTRACREMTNCPHFHDGADCIRFYVTADCNYGTRCKWAHRTIPTRVRRRSPPRDLPPSMIDPRRAPPPKISPHDLSLPPDWRAIQSSAGDVFYFNTITAERTWIHPAQARLTSPPPPPMLIDDRSWGMPPPMHYDPYERDRARDTLPPARRPDVPPPHYGYQGSYESSSAWPRGRSPPPLSRTPMPVPSRRLPSPRDSRAPPPPSSASSSSSRRGSPPRPSTRHRRSLSPGSRDRRPVHTYRPGTHSSSSSGHRDKDKERSSSKKPAVDPAPSRASSSSSATATATATASSSSSAAPTTPALPSTASATSQPDASSQQQQQQPPPLAPPAELSTPPSSPPRSSSLSTVARLAPPIPALGRVHISRALGGNALHERSLSYHRATHREDPLEDSQLAANEAAEAASARRQLDALQETCSICNRTDSLEWSLYGLLSSKGLCCMCSQISAAPAPLLNESVAQSAFERAQQLIAS